MTRDVGIARRALFRSDAIHAVVIVALVMPPRVGASSKVDVLDVKDVTNEAASLPTLEECIALASSDVREKKLVGMLLATKVLDDQTPVEAFDRVAKALGSKFLDSLLKPKMSASADAEESEDAMMSATLGLSVCRAFCRSSRFAASKTMEYWLGTFVDAGARRGKYAGLSDEAAADALTCVFAFSLAKVNANVSKGRGGFQLVDGAFEAAIGALVRSKGEQPLASAAVGIIDLTFALTEVLDDAVRAAAVCIPALCAVLHNAVGEDVQLRVLSLLYTLFYEAFLGGLEAPPGVDLPQPESANAPWQNDCLSGLWIVLSSRTPREVRFMAMALVSAVATYSGAKWLTAEKLTPPPVVLAGAVSGGAQKKVPSFLALVTQLTRVEINVALHELLNGEHESNPNRQEIMQAAKRDASTSLCLYETLIDAVSDIATLVDDEQFELNDAMGRISATELGKTLETLEDVFRSILSVLEDDVEWHSLDPFLVIGLLRCVSCHIAENPLLEAQRVERLLPYLFNGKFTGEWVSNVMESLGCTSREAEPHLVMCQESLIRFFAAYFMLIADDPTGVETCVNSEWLSLTCSMLVKKHESDDAMDAMFLDMVSGVLRRLMEKFATHEAQLSVEVKSKIMQVVTTTSKDLGIDSLRVMPDDDDESDDLTCLFGRVSLESSANDVDVSDAFAAFSQRLRRLQPE